MSAKSPQDAQNPRVLGTPQEEAVSYHHLKHHFANLDQQRETASFGMWVFLITEVMFFGGMFTAYLVYRTVYFDAWKAGSSHMEFWYGTINTAVLICSSLTMALGVHASQEGKRKALVLFLIITLLFGLAFMGIKGAEYYEHWVKHEFPGPSFRFDAPDPQRVELFFLLYWIMTGFHALHVLIGMCIISVIAWMAWKGSFTKDYHNPVENTGLYWHFVDTVWIFLYPLLYLISHSHK